MSRVWGFAPSRRIVENDAKRMAQAIPHGADAMAHVDAVAALAAPHRAMAHREYDRAALGQGHHCGARLHPRSLLGQHELAASEVVPWLRQQDGDLQRENV